MHKAAGSSALFLAVAMMGCTPKAELTPEQQCSAPETYDNLTQIMSSSASQAASLLGVGDGTPLVSQAASKVAIGKIVSYSLPTVDEYNKDTKKISCSALARFNATTAELLTSKVSLSVNDYGPDHVTYKISYTIQPSADGKQNVYTLASADDLAGVAFQSSLIAVRAMQGSMQQAEPEQSNTTSTALPESEDTTNSADSTTGDSASDISINQETGTVDPQ